ncbi:MAG: hypothetical protein Q8Q06_03315 [bacterium]|nr:hypothetical protein [bacterium]
MQGINKKNIRIYMLGIKKLSKKIVLTAIDRFLILTKNPCIDMGFFILKFGLSLY